MYRYTLTIPIKILLCAFLVTLLGACESNDGDNPSENDHVVTFNHEGLDGREIVHLYEHNTELFAATDQGLFTRSEDGQWQSAGLSQAEILDIAFIGTDHYIASVRQIIDDPTSAALMETTDGGQTWQTIEHNFGGDVSETIYALHYDGDNNALYATGVDALAASYDEGRTWELLSGIWGGFGQPLRVVKRNPATNEIWYGGQNAIEQMVLRRYSLDTQEEVSFPDLLPSPAVIYSIHFDSENDYGVYVSGEGGVLKTENNGEDWRTLIGDVNHRFYFDLAIDPLDPDTLYTGGWDKNWETPQPLIFEMSTDDGNSWTEHRHPSDELFGGVRSILATTELGVTVVYLGLYGGGIMKVTILP